MTTLKITPRRAEIILCAARGDLWRSNTTGKIYTSSEGVTHQAGAMLRVGWLRVDPNRRTWRRERTDGDLIEGKTLRPSQAGRAAVANLAGWSGNCLREGIGPFGVEITPLPDPLGEIHHAGLSLDDLALSGGCSRKADCATCSRPDVAQLLSARTFAQALPLLARQGGQPVAQLCEAARAKMGTDRCFDRLCGRCYPAVRPDVAGEGASADG